MQTGKRKLQAGLQQWMQALPFLLAGFVLMALFVLYPLVRNIWISFTDLVPVRAASSKASVTES